VTQYDEDGEPVGEGTDYVELGPLDYHVSDAAAERIAQAIDGLTGAIQLLASVSTLAVPAHNAPQLVAPQAQPHPVAVPPPPALGPQQGVSWGGSAPPQNLGDWVCPVHGTVKVVPAGVSKRTQKPYSAFLACPERDCNEKPPRVA